MIMAELLKNIIKYERISPEWNLFYDMPYMRKPTKRLTDKYYEFDKPLYLISDDYKPTYNSIQRLEYGGIKICLSPLKSQN